MRVPGLHLTRDSLVEECPHPTHGWLVLVRGKGEFYLGWRRDRRIRKQIRWISAHPTEPDGRRGMEDSVWDPPPKRKSRRKRDHQWRAVYNWEYYCLRPKDRYREHFTIEECQAFVTQVYRRMNLPDPPRVTTRRHDRSAAYHPDENELRLPKWARNAVVILHELSHAILWKEKKFAADHGPEFVRTFMDLLVRFGNFGRPYLERTLDRRGIIY